MQKSSYNYAKKMTFVHSAWLLSGPGIVTVSGTFAFISSPLTPLMSRYQVKTTSAIGRS